MNQEERQLDVEISESSDDEAPDDVSFEKGRSLAVQQAEKEKLTLQAATSEKKRKAREKQEKLKADQDARAHRKLNRLPDEILTLLPAVNESKRRTERSEIVNKNKPIVKRSNANAKFQNAELSTDTTQYVIGNQGTASKQKRTTEAEDFLKHHFYGKRLHRADGGPCRSKKGRLKAAYVFCKK